jgi:hypothetical protein
MQLEIEGRGRGEYWKRNKKMSYWIDPNMQEKTKICFKGGSQPIILVKTTITTDNSH